MQDSAIRNSCLKYSFNAVSTNLFTDEKTFTVVTPKNLKNRQQQPTKDVATKRLRTRSTFVQSQMASVGES